MLMKVPLSGRKEGSLCGSKICKRGHWVMADYVKKRLDTIFEVSNLRFKDARMESGVH
jgi:hypothetical protein